MTLTFLTTSLPFLETVLRLGAATAIGCALGLNREMHAKPAGMRTHALVALGTALVTLTGIVLAGHDGRFDSKLERALHRLMGTRGGG